jgi:predicted TPR repeat methyltransferase
MTNTSFWDKAAPKYAKDPISDMTSYNETLERMRTILQPHNRVLEIGCGTGSTALQLAYRVDQYVGTDVSPKMISIAQSKLADDAPAHLSFATHAADDLPTGPHDVILALNLLHLLPNLEDVLAQIYAALPSGGMFIAKTGLLKDGLRVLPWILPVLRLVGKAPFVRSLSGLELTNLLESAGFEVTETLTQQGTVPRFFTVARKP